MEENHRDLGRVADPGRAVRALDEEFEETVAPTGSVSHREEARLFLRRVLAYFYILSWVFRVNHSKKIAKCVLITRNCVSRIHKTTRNQNALMPISRLRVRNYF